MYEGFNAELCRQADCAVVAGVIHQQYFVDKIS